MVTRRNFLAASGVLASLPRLHAAPAGIRYAYAAITWNKEERQAIDDISSAGYAGIQLRQDALTEFQPAQLRDLLAEHKLAFVALSSEDVTIDPEKRAETIAMHVDHARYVKDAGGAYLQVLDQLKAYPRKVTADEAKTLGRLLTELGKRTADLGIPLTYHNHMNTISEHPENLQIVMETSDPKYVNLLFDTAHSLAGGGDPAMEIEKYGSRIDLLHLKDVVPASMDTKGARYPFTWVELGRGKVDFPAVFAGLEKIRYRGWAVVELDRVPDPPNTAKDCAIISRDFLRQKMGVKFPG